MSVDTKTLGKQVNELLVLATLREGPKHGYQIALDVEERSDGTFELQHGTLYPILHRLEDDGFVKGSWSEEGRRRKEYRLTRRGRKRLGEGAGRVEALFTTLIEILEEAGGDQIHPSPATG